MTKSELISKIDNGSDILIDVAGRHFAIFTWCREGIGIGEQYLEDDTLTYFETSTQLVEQFLINGIPIEKHLSTLRITDYS